MFLTRGGSSENEAHSSKRCICEQNTVKDRKCNMCREWCMQQLCLNITARNKRLESNPECLQLKYERKHLSKSFGRK